MPAGEPVDTLLWQPGVTTSEGGVRWRMLISGDETEWLGPLVQERKGGWAGLVSVFGVLLLGVGLVWGWDRRRSRGLG